VQLPRVLVVPVTGLALLGMSTAPLAAASADASAQVSSADTLRLDLAVPAARMSPIHHGLMTEEINYCYDGGLYAELIRNRAFRDDAEKPAHWSAVGGATLTLDAAVPLNAAIPGSLRVEFPAATSAAAPAGVANAGWWGMPITPATSYRATIHARAAAGFSGPLVVSLQSRDGAVVFAEAKIKKLASDWQAHELTLKTKRGVAPTTDARLVISSAQPGSVWLGFVSLFPPTWKDRPNGLRRDLMRMMIDMKPRFLRFPGGNYLEGETIDTRFKWWETLGPIHERPGHMGTWGYRSSDGMGLLEFLLWAQDIGAEPVLGLYAGYSLKGDYVKPGPDLEPFIQEALDEIEYVIGDTSTKWGARRAADGHPEPFPLRYVEIGNEDWFDKSLSYDGRYAQFQDAIKAKYPQLKCISSVGNEQPAEKRVHSRRPDVLDEHYYRNTEAFLEMSPRHFDNYDRSGPEIFVGEWAAHETAFPPWDAKSKGLPCTPNFKAAIGDAAFLAAMERVGDLVTMQCYAPLFANVNEYQWRPDLIGYDALHAYGSPSYYTIKLFSTKLGDEIVKPVFSEGTKLQGSATRDSKTGKLYVKVVNPEPAARELRVELSGARRVSAGRATVLAAALDATNSLAEPRNVAPVESKLPKLAPTFTHTLPPHSITVLEFTAR
jgi:alpha-N-arabinofuranosidase